MSENMHESITAARIVEACRHRVQTETNPGMCVSCGVDVENVDSLVAKQKCEVCGEDAVYGCVAALQLFRTDVPEPEIKE